MNRVLVRINLAAALVLAIVAGAWGLQAEAATPPAPAPAAAAPRAAVPASTTVPAAAFAPDPATAAAAAATAAGEKPPKLEAPRMFALSLPKLALVLAFAALVFYLCNWAFLDARFVSTDRVKWGLLVLIGGLAGLAAVIVVPVLYAGLSLGVIFLGGASVTYAVHRNTLVTPPLKVLTGAHLVRLRRRLFGRSASDAASGPVSGAGRPIFFMGFDDLPINLELTSPAEQQAMREIERVLHDAILRRASTAGYLAKPGKGEVKYRISGETRAAPDVERPASDHFCALVKRMAGLDPTETRKPQEGRIRAIVATQPFELRIKAAGTVKGEQIAVRFIDVATSQLKLDQLGLAEGAMAALKDALSVRPGLVILSGPQDSGLTTTIHACLRHFDRYVNNVVVFEPHTDVEVENVQHVLVNQEDGPVATAEVRSRIRMEPDVVAFDSVALPEIAGLLAEASKEHTVLVGIRAADAVQALARLTTLLGSPQALADRLQAVANQRVVRLLCPDCKEAYRPNPDFLRKANLGAAKVDILYRPPTRSAANGKDAPAVCPKCNNERYFGRTGLFEVMPIDAVAREMIGRGAAAADIRTYIRKSGMRNLQEEGLQMVIEGSTSIEEVLRAVKQSA